MKNLLTIKEQDILPDSPSVDTSAFRKRGAARAVLLDDNGQVYLLNVSKHGYHKLPGGGIDEGEDIKQALERELMEEVGCKAEIQTELGTVLEYRNYDDGGLQQTSYCYLAKQVGEQVASALEEGELAEGMFEVKAKSIDDAIALLSQDKPDNLEGKFIQKRDIAFLQAAKEQE
ncbi:MAG: NUDIX domain-containing protein [Candidatus Saccharimonadaceae bacterium]